MLVLGILQSDSVIHTCVSIAFTFRLVQNTAQSSGEGNGTPLQYSCLENPMDGGAWWAAVHR